MTTHQAFVRIGRFIGACVLCIGGALPILAHAGDPIPDLPVNAPLPLGEKGSQRTIEVIGRTTMQVGENVGSQSSGMFCSGELPLTVKDLNAVKAMMTRFTYVALSKAGYTRFDPNQSAFDSPESRSADFKLGATLKHYQYNLCRSGANASGGASFKVFWELFSAREQKVVFSATTEGSFNSKESMLYEDLNRKAENNAVNNLLAMPAFVAAYEADFKPGAPAGTGAANESGAAVAAQAPTGPVLDTITLMKMPPPKGGVPVNADALRAAVFTVEITGSSGSGFLIDPQGYIITNYHVVKNEKYVRVKQADGTTVTGQVLRSDVKRDVALIKIDPINRIAPLAIRTNIPAVAEEVYAIGSPLGRAFAGTLTKGIISSNDRMVNGYPFFQADVSVTHGNSGGPLLDANGQVIGITDLGFGSALNMFIPIADALSKLAIEVR